VAVAVAAAVEIYQPNAVSHPGPNRDDVSRVHRTAGREPSRA